MIAAEVYVGRERRGVITTKAGVGYEARDAKGRKLGAFSTSKAATRAVVESSERPPAKH